VTGTPGRAAVITVALLAADAGIALVLGAPLVAAVLAVIAAAAAVAFRRVPVIDDDDLEALAEATREDIPDHVPAE